LKEICIADLRNVHRSQLCYGCLLPVYVVSGHKWAVYCNVLTDNKGWQHTEMSEQMQSGGLVWWTTRITRIKLMKRFLEISSMRWGSLAMRIRMNC